MNISTQQLDAAKRGEAVRLQADDVEVVLLRADLFRQMEIQQQADDPRQAYPAVLRAWDADDDPDSYEEYRNS